jgi:DnaJ-class molecular chaperone
MTPYATLLVKPTDDDKTIRKTYHRLVEDHHPDRNAGVPGPRWETLTRAYNAIKTLEARERWEEAQKMLAARCSRCSGSGVGGTRMFKGRIRVCDICEGSG